MKANYLKVENCKECPFNQCQEKCTCYDCECTHPNAKITTDEYCDEITKGFPKECPLNTSIIVLSTKNSPYKDPIVLEGKRKSDRRQICDRRATKNSIIFDNRKSDRRETISRRFVDM